MKVPDLITFDLILASAGEFEDIKTCKKKPTEEEYEEQFEDLMVE